MTTDKQKGGEQKVEEDIRPKKVDPKRRFALGMAKAGAGHLPAKDSLDGV